MLENKSVAPLMAAVTLIFITVLMVPPIVITITKVSELQAVAPRAGMIQLLSNTPSVGAVTVAHVMGDPVRDLFFADRVCRVSEADLYENLKWANFYLTKNGVKVSENDISHIILPGKEWEYGAYDLTHGRVCVFVFKQDRYPRPGDKIAAFYAGRQAAEVEVLEPKEVERVDIAVLPLLIKLMSLLDPFGESMEEGYDNEDDSTAPDWRTKGFRKWAENVCGWGRRCPGESWWPPDFDRAESIVMEMENIMAEVDRIVRNSEYMEDFWDLDGLMGMIDRNMIKMMAMIHEGIIRRLIYLAENRYILTRLLVIDCCRCRVKENYDFAEVVVKRMNSTLREIERMVQRSKYLDSIEDLELLPIGEALDNIYEDLYTAVPTPYQAYGPGTPTAPETGGETHREVNIKLYNLGTVPIERIVRRFRIYVNRRCKDVDSGADLAACRAEYKRCVWWYHYFTLLDSALTVVTEQQDLKENLFLGRAFENQLEPMCGWYIRRGEPVTSRYGYPGRVGKVRQMDLVERFKRVSRAYGMDKIYDLEERGGAICEWYDLRVPYDMENVGAENLACLQVREDVVFPENRPGGSRVCPSPPEGYLCDKNNMIVNRLEPGEWAWDNFVFNIEQNAGGNCYTCAANLIRGWTIIKFELFYDSVENYDHIRENLKATRCGPDNAFLLYWGIEALPRDLAIAATCTEAV